MSDSNKPLFSRPVLAAIMLFCTLAIWLLNLTAPGKKLATPSIETWTTTSGIPVIWLKQEQWQESDKLEIRFTFRAATTNTPLIQTTLALLMSDSLPLSTASINQRLTPLAASASSYYDHERQSIGITLSSDPQYLVPTLSLLNNWLTAPEFKHRTFENWQRQQQNNPQIQHQLEEILFFDNTQPQRESDNVTISLQDVSNYYQHLTTSATAIYIIGDMSAEAKMAIQNAINTISQDYRLSNETVDNIQHAPLSATIQQQEGELWQTRSALALTPITSVEDWISLQIWGADLVATLNQQPHIDFAQLTLILSPQNPWAWWSIQYGNNINTDLPTDDAMRFINAKSLIFVEEVPSINHPKTFKMLLDNFKQQLEQQSLSPTWWSNIATQVTNQNGPLTLEKFATDYQEAINNFSIEEYKTTLKTLLKPSSYQEIQVYQ
ncbi:MULTISPECIES: insulinase family protein [Marinomonas]|uniref:Insulinase family protein n=1 Tax=Marinomonas rhodophyticola TaxID=2992803 RepID=A0ABT3KI90_9GAMM|nr:insulinase family protein [Marinomonas sp. KJ51-3]MCW4630154.1 insulinase family protein [Marinomonas sp. KJ51-3]